jgi:hypothetical protein
MNGKGTTSVVPLTLQEMPRFSACGFASGRHHLGILVGDIARRCCAVGICVCELHLQAKEVEHVCLSEGARGWRPGGLRWPPPPERIMRKIDSLCSQ